MGQSSAPRANASAPAPGKVSDADKLKIDAWIEQLGDASYIQRQVAREALERIGLPAFESLRAAEHHPNVEIAHTAAFLLQSMNVDWTSATDSFDVHQLLKDYNERNQSSKLLCLQRLAFLKRADGYIAILRLLRYDNDEIVSKHAALHLFEAALEPDESLSNKNKIADWPAFLRNGLGENSRVGATWLLALADSLSAPQMEMDRWQRLILAERKLLESNAKSSTKELKTNDEVVKLLYRNIARLLIKQDKHQDAVAFFEPCLELVGTSSTGVEGDIQWMLEVNLPESVIALSDQYPRLFVARPKFRYWLAESCLRTGQTDRAEELAAEARQLLHVKRDVGNTKAMPGRYDGETTQRMSMADTLAKRGMFRWAEAEMVIVQQLQAQYGLLTVDQQLLVYDQMSMFYWSGDEPAKAAAVWQPLLKRAGLISDLADDQPKGSAPETKPKDTKPQDTKQPNDAKPEKADKEQTDKQETDKKQTDKDQTDKEETDQDLQNLLEEMRAPDLKRYSVYTVGRYYFYLGLAATKENRLDEAKKYLRKAIAVDDEDPDFLIALYKVVGDDREAEAELTNAIGKLESKYRSEIARSGTELAAATTRSMRNDSEESIALTCNQLAWLLAGTERRAIEAIALSERSLMIQNDDPVLMDTLARCYFAAGNVDKAIYIQSRAVALRPFERTMKRQLDEFVAAKNKAAIGWRGHTDPIAAGWLIVASLCILLSLMMRVGEGRTRLFPGLVFPDPRDLPLLPKIRHRLPRLWIDSLLHSTGTWPSPTSFVAQCRRHRDLSVRAGPNTAGIQPGSAAQTQRLGPKAGDAE